MSYTYEERKNAYSQVKTPDELLVFMDKYIILLNVIT